MIFSSKRMISIDNVLIDEDIINKNFSCDLKKCKGACCTLPGGSGAPLLKHEIELIRNSFNSAKKYLNEKSINAIEHYNFFEMDDGEAYTTCIDNKDCVFVFYEGDVAKCSLERAYFDNKSDFRKPLSCHLFPIRIGSFNGPYLYYDKFKECDPALIKGDKTKTKIFQNVKDALVREYGEDFYKKLEAYLEHINNDK